MRINQHETGITKHNGKHKKKQNDCHSEKELLGKHVRNKVGENNGDKQNVNAEENTTDDTDHVHEEGVSRVPV